MKVVQFQYCSDTRALIVLTDEGKIYTLCKWWPESKNGYCEVQLPESPKENFQQQLEREAKEQSII